MIVVYRAPCGNLHVFITRLDCIIKSLNEVEWKLIICNDINIGYLMNNDKRRQLDVMLLSYNPSAIVHYLYSTLHTLLYYNLIFVCIFNFNICRVHPVAVRLYRFMQYVRFAFTILIFVECILSLYLIV
jgi:hypothetical protein